MLNTKTAAQFDYPKPTYCPTSAERGAHEFCGHIHIDPAYAH